MSTSLSMLKFQIGPVQDFIATARSTRDLWSGSYLLSWLVASGIKALPQDSKLVFPATEAQPLLRHPLNPAESGILIPNLPNIFIAKVTGDAKKAAEAVTDAITTEWKQIATAVWNKRQSLGLPDSFKDRFFAQVDRHLSISWMTTEVPDDSDHAYVEAYRHNGWHLDAVRQTREFKGWVSVNGSSEKDSLSGKEEAVFHGSGNPNKTDVWHNLLNKHADHMGAVAIIKRVWHLAYLRDQHGLPTDSVQFPIRSIPAIAARLSKLDDDEDAQEKTTGEKYIAAIAFDGDSIGKWVNGDFLPETHKLGLKQHHTAFSKALSDFALNRVREIVEEMVDGTDDKGRAIQVPLGQLIYAGGDDVVCLVPADAALDVADKLRKAFQKATSGTESTGEKPDASAGIAIAHVHAPLQDLIREAQKAEKRAKTDVGRPAFSITLMKRSGEISHWGSKWGSRGLELYRAIAENLKPDGLSDKFPHRVCELLSPYLTSQTSLSKQEDAIRDISLAKDLITREFAHAAERQGSKELAKSMTAALGEYLDGIIKAREERERKIGKPSSRSVTQELLTSVIGLCTTVAFADRTKPAPAEKQPAA
ncbi:MAG: type III-B CRISPR-associated protein Cas10/Cmr2 [Verrucomicrobiota bacterium JB025]|nr:type III-B CRISPR-associated protein Cas10/Cmr2 [Verrucomicrobiota bacterium JB025]